MKSITRHAARPPKFDPEKHKSAVHRYCSVCRHEVSKVEVDGRRRRVCLNCGFIYYKNPLPVAVCLAVNRKRELLLIRRGIEPAKGTWSLPSGFVEWGESPRRAALRELKEETGVRGRIVELFDVIHEVGAIYPSLIAVIYLMAPAGGRPRPGSDALDARYVPLTKVPRLGIRAHNTIVKQFCRKAQRARRNNQN